MLAYTRVDIRTEILQEPEPMSIELLIAAVAVGITLALVCVPIPPIPVEDALDTMLECISIAKLKKSRCLLADLQLTPFGCSNVPSDAGKFDF